MEYLYVTADKIGAPTGGGVVTHHESTALRTLGLCEVGSRDWFDFVANRHAEHRWAQPGEPWFCDYVLANTLRARKGPFPKLAHFYAGTFGESVKILRENGCKVVYTIAAHDKEVSRREHEKLGWPFPYTHLTEESLWQRYIEGYRLADVIVCPSEVAADTVRRYGPDFVDKRIEVIPHGCDLPEGIALLPPGFTVGYLGAIGADKGLTYLIQAWGQLGYWDAKLVIAGKDSVSPWVIEQVHRYVKHPWTVDLRGWVDNVSGFYNSINLYVQPSATEGFGIEVLEAMVHGRPVLCSMGAGAQDLVPWAWRVGVGDVAVLASMIHRERHQAIQPPPNWREIALRFTWDKVREQYVNLWRSLL